MQKSSEISPCPHNSLKDAVTELIDEYQSLNDSVVTELHEEPSPLEFLRHVYRNRPFVLRKGALDWTPVSTWTGDYLKSVLKDRDVNVAFTPHGNADSPTTVEGELLFVKPHEIQMPFEKALERICENERGSGGSVAYAQTRTKAPRCRDLN
jgi:jumonji domain-containing protein 7